MDVNKERIYIQTLHDKNKVIGEGIDFKIYFDENDIYGKMAVRVPKNNIIEYGEEKYKSADIIKKEVRIYEFLTKYNVKVPRLYKYSIDEQNTFLAYEYIDNDKSEINNQELGECLSQIHNIDISDLKDFVDFKNCISIRLYDRLVYIEEKLDIKNPFHSSLEIFESIQSNNKASLLHMDMRPDNILTKNGSIRAIIDWTYALIGDPLLELYRMDEFDYSNNYRLINEDFKLGYKLRLNPVHKLTELVYRLDASAMVLILFAENNQFSDLIGSQMLHVKEQCRLVELELQKNCKTVFQ